MGREIAIFGEFSLVCDAGGRDALVYRVDGSVCALPSTVDQPADEAGESLNRSEEEPLVA